MEKMKNRGKKGKKGAEQQDGEPTSRRTNSSAKVFSNLQKIVAGDYKKRDEKREARESGKKGGTSGQHGSMPTHGQASKRFKMW